MAAALLLPGVAQGATIFGGVTPAGPPPAASSVPLTIAGVGDEANAIEVVTGGAGFIVRETGAAPLTENAQTCNPTGNPKEFSCSLTLGGYAGVTPVILANLGSGNDSLRVTTPPIPVLANGEAGEDTFFATPGAGVLNGGDGFDTVDLSPLATPVIIGVGGATHSVPAVERIIGGSANDTFLSAAYGEVFEGRGGVDTVTYENRPADQPITAIADGAANDGAAGEGDNIAPDVENLFGGAGNDLMGGAGGVANLLNGGGGTDTATYAGRPDGVTANLDDGANDGAAGEGDQLVGFESLTGGEGNDFLTGSPGPNGLSGGGGNDVLDGGDGPDSLSGDGGNDQLTGGAGVDGYAGGEGDDSVTAFDGLSEAVDCGNGNDAATVDAADRLSACETVRRVDEALDVDRDGSLPPADCNDNNAAIRPGARDIPRNGVDEDCSGRDARRRSVQSTVRNQWAFNSVFTQVRTFSVRKVPARSVVKVKCKAPKGKRGACPFGTRRRESVGGAKRMSFTSAFKQRRLPVGTVIEVRVTRKGWIGRVVRFTTRSNRIPKARTLCLQPGRKKPKRC